ncbi:hypothetical protein F5Y18DRAFT_159828 [Xylariaceae sp. FL1019]|nr:hypothetical protein F5Y18DRAFT_159828 [Xylariaceae sp. FL1019]
MSAVQEELRPSFLKSCAAGDLARAEQLYASLTPVDIMFAQEALINAVDNKHSAIIDFLLQKLPGSFTSKLPEKIVLHAVDAGTEILERLLRHDPSLAEGEFGHQGDLLAMAVMANDLDLVRLLISHGASPLKSTMFHRPILDVAKTQKRISQSIVQELNRSM